MLNKSDQSDRAPGPNWFRPLNRRRSTLTRLGWTNDAVGLLTRRRWPAGAGAIPDIGNAITEAITTMPMAAGSAVAVGRGRLSGMTGGCARCAAAIKDEYVCSTLPVRGPCKGPEQTYDAACKRWPGKMIILRTGALVLEESRKTRALREDANATYSESGLPKCNARHRRKRRAGTRCSPSECVHHGTGVCRFTRDRPNAVRYGSCGRHLRRSFVWRLSRKGKRIGEMPGWAGQQANWCKLVEVHSGATRGAA